MINVAPLLANQTFGAWLTTTNKMANLFSTNTVTSDNTVGGSLTTGNVFVNGYFGANYLYVNTALSGGNNSTNNVLFIVSNTNLQYAGSNLVTFAANGSSSKWTMATSNVAISPTNTTQISGPSLNVSATNTFISSNAVSITANSTSFVGPITVGPNATFNTLSTSGSNAYINAASVFLTGNTLNFTGNVTYSNTVTVSNTFTGLGSGFFANNLVVTNNANVGTLFVANSGNSAATIEGGLTVLGPLTLAGGVNYGSQISSFTFNNSTAANTVDSFPTSQYRSAEYLMQLSDTTTVPASYQITKLLITQDGTNPWITEYGTVYNNVLMGTFTAGIYTVNSTPQVNVIFTPVSSNVVAKFVRTAIVV